VSPKVAASLRESKGRTGTTETDGDDSCDVAQSEVPFSEPSRITSIGSPSSVPTQATK
jgi:hypothetical protein